MRRTIGIPVHHSALEQGKIYYLKHDSLGEAEVEFLGANTFQITTFKLTSPKTKKSWTRGNQVTLPNYEGAHFYEPSL